MSKRQHKKSYSERMQGKKKDFLKRAYNGREFKLEKEQSVWKTTITGTVINYTFDTEYNTYVYTIEYKTNEGETCICYIFRDTNDLEIGSIYDILKIYDIEVIERNTKATKKYKKILDKAHSTQRNKENRKSHEKKHKFREYDYENLGGDIF